MTSLSILRIDADSLTRRVPALASLLIDTVEHGASVGFVLPLSPAEAADYWRGLLDSVASGTRLLSPPDTEASNGPLPLHTSDSGQRGRRARRRHATSDNRDRREQGDERCRTALAAL